MGPNNKLSIRNAVQLLLLVSSIFVSSAICSANDVYMAQNAGGAGDGSSCANARAVSFFNSSGNWGAGSTQIGPGTVVHLCGTVTTNLTFQTNGASGNPVVLDGTGAILNAGVTVATSYWTIQNVTWATSFPTSGATVISVMGAAFGTITGNTLDVNAPAPVIGLRQTSSATALAHDIVISNNFIRNAASSAAVQADLLTTEGSYNITVQGNRFEMRAMDNNNHDDCIQTWEKGGSSAGPPHDWTIRYNLFVMNTPSTNNKSWTMLEGFTGKMDIYGNVFLGIVGASSGNGINFNSNQGSMVANIYDNTVVSKNNGPNNILSLQGSGTFNVRNNIVYSTSAGSAFGGNATRDHNLWFGPGSPSCNATEICGRNPMFTDFAGNDFSLLPSSPAVGTGANLGNVYNRSPLEGSNWPNPMIGTRPATGPWDMGGFVDSSGATTAPAPPTGLEATVI